jgi:hypothetical protein
MKCPRPYGWIDGRGLVQEAGNSLWLKTATRAHNEPACLITQSGRAAYFSGVMVVMPPKDGERVIGAFEPPKTSRRLKLRRRVVAAAPDPPDPLLSHVLSAEPRVSGVLFLGLGVSGSGTASTSIGTSSGSTEYGCPGGRAGVAEGAGSRSDLQHPNSRYSYWYPRRPGPARRDLNSQISSLVLHSR